MKSLADLQRAFCDALRSPDAPAPELLEQLLDDGFAPQRINVYRNNFVVLNGDALAEMYPVVQRLIGEDAFRLLASAYVRRYPPMGRTLLLYGDRFAEFLAGVPELSALPYLPDVARLEYAWSRSYHAEDAAPLTASELNAIEPHAFDRVRLVPHPSLSCLASAYPVLRIWQSNQHEDPQEVVSLDEGPCRMVLIRPYMEVETRAVNEGALRFLEQLQAGKSVAAAYADAATADAAFDLSDFFSRHLLDGTFVALQRLVD